MTESSEAKIERFVGEVLAQGLDKADASQIEKMLNSELKSTRFNLALGTTQLGTGTRLRKFLDECGDQIRQNLCKDGKLDPDWEKILRDDDLSQLLKSLATTLLGLINPAFAVPSVAVLAALWMIRKGLNNWCSQTLDQLLNES